MQARGHVTDNADKAQGDADEEARCQSLGEKWFKKYHAVDSFANGDTNGFLDTTAGITLADKVSTVAIASLLYTYD